MTLKQIAVGVWIETDAIGAVTNKNEAKDGVRRQETRIISKSGAELYAHITIAQMVDMNEIYAANRTHEIMLRELGLKDDPRVNPYQA